jgi:hypothetical protein
MFRVRSSRTRGQRNARVRNSPSARALDMGVEGRHRAATVVVVRVLRESYRGESATAHLEDIWCEKIRGYSSARKNVRYP